MLKSDAESFLADVPHGVRGGDDDELDELDDELELDCVRVVTPSCPDPDTVVVLPSESV